MSIFSKISFFYSIFFKKLVHIAQQINYFSVIRAVQTSYESFSWDIEDIKKFKIILVEDQ